MAYIGQVPALGNFRKLDDISGSFNGSTREFEVTISGVPAVVTSSKQCLLSLNGVIQEPNVSFDIGTTQTSIAFVEAPSAGDTFWCIIVGDALDIAGVSDDVISTIKIQDQAVTTDKLADDAVTAAKLADNVIDTPVIVDGAVTNAKIEDNAVTLQKIQDNAITTTKIVDAAVTYAKIDSDSLAAQFVPNYRNGCTISNNLADSEHDIDIEAGLIADSTNTKLINAPAITKRIDASWVLGSGNGGRSGTIDPDTWYHVFVTMSLDGLEIDAGFDTSLTATNLLSDTGHTYYRRVGSVRTDSSSNIIEFLQLDKLFLYKDQTAHVQYSVGAVTGVTSGTFTAFGPTGLNTLERLFYDFGAANGSADYVQVWDSSAGFTTPAAQRGSNGASGDLNTFLHEIVDIYSSSTKTLDFAHSYTYDGVGGTGGSLNIYSLGYTDLEL